MPLAGPPFGYPDTCRFPCERHSPGETRIDMTKRLIAVLLFATLATVACSSSEADVRVPDQLVIDGHTITLLHDRPCPVPDRPVSQYWRDVLMAAADRDREEQGRHVDIADIEALNPSGDSIILGDWGRDDCNCLHAYIQLFHWRGGCAQDNGLRCAQCI